MPKYIAPYATVDLDKDHELLDALATQMRRTDFQAYLDKWSTSNQPVPEDDPRKGIQTVGWPRYPTMEVQLKSPDINKRGKESVSCDVEIMNNVHKAASWGPTVCSLCNQTMIATGLASMIGHIAQVHPDIAESVFSCPTCLKVVMCTRETFKDHWDTVHASTEALISVLDATCTGARISWGLALVSFLETVRILDLDVGWLSSKAMGEMQLSSELGGYARIDVRQLLVLLGQMPTKLFLHLVWEHVVQMHKEGIGVEVFL
jgi:hypothetical protein